MSTICKCVAKAALMSAYCTLSWLWKGLPSSSRAMRLQRVAMYRHQYKSSFALQASSSRKGHNRDQQQKKNPNKPKTSFEINPNWKQDYDAAALSEAFDELAKLDGFDESTVIEDGEQRTAQFEGEEDENFFILDDDENDVISFDSVDDRHDNNDDDMDQRIAMAKRDQIFVPQELDQFSTMASADALEKIGFQRELNPFGTDETPRSKAFTIRPVQNALQCTACGSDFQHLDPYKPGYLPPDKYEIQLKLSQVEKAQQLQAKLLSNEWTAEEEIQWLLNDKANNNNQSNKGDLSNDNNKMINIPTLVQDLGLQDHIDSGKRVICKRCHGLQNFGVVENALRPGWTEEPTISQEAFQRMLSPLATKKAVIIALVDLFDFSGSVLPQLNTIVGETNPVLIAANKADLFPSKMGQHRAENWVRRELEYLGIDRLANVGGAVRLVSCKTGFGVNALLQTARELAEEMDCDIYLIGAANAGKSTLINRITSNMAAAAPNDDLKTPQANDRGIKSRPGNVNAKKGLVTTSPLPGTTLKFIKFDLGDGKNLFDTPGLLIPGSLTQRLTAEELKLVVPKKEVEPITFRVASSKCVLIGGLAQIEVIGDSRPFLLTFFVSNDVRLHPTDSSKAKEFREKHTGILLTPPLTADRIDDIGEMESHTLDIEGMGWKNAAADIAIRGLGWVSVTGAGIAKLRVSVPKGIGISVRPPIMPFDVWESTARFTGGRAVRKSGRSATGKRRGGVGRK